jgi:pimeloyl-ACP methyl ester carboxylesterase
VCLHTAGADSRQYRQLLCDAEVVPRWRVIAFDLPYHGRSMPPGAWWKKEYLLTTRLYADTVMAFVRTLGLEHPVILGCSMGGAVVLELARGHASELGAVIGLEAASKIEGRFTDWSVMPDVNDSEMIATWIYGLMAPQSPEASRRVVWWIYSQGGPGVYVETPASTGGGRRIPGRLRGLARGGGRRGYRTDRRSTRLLSWL